MLALLALAMMGQNGVRVAPERVHFRYEREIQVPSGTSGRTCAALDGTVFAHSPALADVRLYAGGHEIPYALMQSQAAATGDVARVMNLGERGGHIVFDLAMPPRPYSRVDLELTGQNFLATARVTGGAGAGKDGCCGVQTALGSFTLFDLSAQHLGRSTSLGLGETSFPYLHVELDAVAAPGSPAMKAARDMVAGAIVPPSRVAQTIYTTVAETSAIVQRDRRSVATFEVPAYVPVERVRFELAAADPKNFSRSVNVQARALDEPQGRRTLDEEVTGEISRVRLTEAGKEIRQDSLEVAATIGSNAQHRARIEVAVQNGDDQPLAIKTVRLEMRERKLCFDAVAAMDPGALTMVYGDDAVTAPEYDYSRLFRIGEASAVARLGPEKINPEYVPRVEQKAFTDRHPEVIWVALLAAILALGFVALRSARRI